jgi:hypothetical protein
MKFFSGAAPKRKSKPKPNPFEQHGEYLKLKALIANGKMKPQEVAGIYLDGSDAKALDLKYPARTAADSLRCFVRQMGLAADYHIVKYETDTPGVWAVSVTYEPPRVAAKVKKGASRPRPRIASVHAMHWPKHAQI